MLQIEIIEMEPDRIFRLYGVFLTLAVMFTILAISIRRREGEKTRQRVFLSKFFILSAIGLYANLIYAPFGSIVIQTLGNKFVVLANIMAIVNLAFFTISINKAEVEFSAKKSRIWEVGLLLLVAITYFLPGVFTMEFIEAYSPIWGIAMGIYFLVFSQTFFIICTVVGVKTLIKFESKEVKKRLQYLLIGVLFLEGVVISTLLRNIEIRDLWTLVLSFSIAPSALFLYFGVGKKLT